MEKSNRINWRKGLEVTPLLFLSTDNFSDHQDDIIRRLCTLKSFGIIPCGKLNEMPFYIDTDIRDGILVINDLDCLAVTSSGHLIDTKNNPLALPKKIYLNEVPDGEYYILLKINPGQRPLLKDKKEEYFQFIYDFELKKSLDIVMENSLPILKIINRENVDVDVWEFDYEYIIPSIVLCSDDKLISKFSIIKEKISHIKEKIEDKDLLCQFSLFELELRNYSMYETPFEFVMLLKKILQIIDIYIEESFPSGRQLIEEVYNHYEIAAILDVALLSLNEISQYLERAPEPEPEQEPEPEEYLPEI